MLRNFFIVFILLHLVLNQTGASLQGRFYGDETESELHVPQVSWIDRPSPSAQHYVQKRRLSRDDLTKIIKDVIERELIERIKQIYAVQQRSRAG